MKIFIVFKRELVEHWRNWKLLLLLAAIFGGIIIALYTEVGPTANSTNVMDPFFELFAILCPIIGIFAAMDAVIGEKEKGTLELVLSKPITRSTILYGKFVTYLVIILPLLIFELIGAYYWAQFTGISAVRWQLPMPELSQWLAMVAILAMVAVYYTALTMFISLFSPNTTVTGLIGLVCITPAHPLGGEFLRIASMVVGFTGFNDVPLVLKLPLSIFGKYQKSAITSPQDFWICTGSLLIITIVILLMSTVVFERQNVTFKG